MSNEIPTVSKGDEYIAFFVGGPYDGQADRRMSDDGGWDDVILTMVAVSGKETQLEYAWPTARLVNDEVHVTYHWDKPDSEPLTAVDERNDD